MTDRSFQGPHRPFAASMRVPGDKSLSHRALILASMAAGESEISGLAPGDDVSATIGALAVLGVEKDGPQIRSPGLERWSPPDGAIDARNSATTLRLLAGALAGRPFRSTLVGDASLQTRPMRRLASPLEALGAEIVTSPDGTPPVTVHAPDPLRGAEVVIPLASAQVRSAFELAAIQANGPSRIDGPPGFRDHTERWLASMGRGDWVGSTAFAIHPGPVPPNQYSIPGDPSSAAFLWAAAALQPGAEVTTPDICLNPGRTGFLDVLVAMGAEVEQTVTGDVHGDPIGEVTVRAGPLEAVLVEGELARRALDELPLVAVLAGAATGTTRVSGAAELRVKESDRIATSADLVTALGGQARATEDGFVITGTGGYRGGRADAAGDHRIAMAAAVGATAASGPVVVAGADVIGVSWPGFYDAVEELWSSR